MDLNKIVDVALENLYIQRNKSLTVSAVVLLNGMAFDDTNSEIICDKLDSLPYYGIIKLASRHGSDMILTPNSAGFEFVQKHGSYSNYLQKAEEDQQQARQISERGSRGSFWSGIGAVIAIPMSIASFVYTCQKDRKQEENIQLVTDSLHTTTKKLREVEKTIHRQMKNLAKMDSLGGTRRK